MQVKDVMTPNVISVGGESGLKAVRADAAKPDQRPAGRRDKGELVGMVTEGDFLRRSELGTERRRPKWLEFLSARAARPRIRARLGRKVEEMMTPDPVTVVEDDALEDSRRS